MSQAAAEWEGGTKSAEEGLRRLAGAIPHGLALVRAGRIVWGNEVFLKLAGHDSLADLVGTELAELLADAGQGLPDASPSELSPSECLLSDYPGPKVGACRPIRPMAFVLRQDPG